MDEDVTNLEKLASIYQEKTGHWPSSFSELEATGMLRALPLDPLGHAYKLEAGGKVQVRDPDQLPFIEKGTPPGYAPPTPKFLPSDMGGAS